MSIIDAKLQDKKLLDLIELCKQTQNYKKLSTVGMISINNIINSMGIRLGFKVIEKEQIFEYMILINKTLQKNLHCELFPKAMIDSVKRLEIIFFQKEGILPKGMVKELFSLYFDLRKIDVPNIFLPITENKDPNIPNLSLYSALFSGNKKKRASAFTPETLMLQNIKQREIALRDQLKSQYNRRGFEEMVTLKAIKEGIREQDHEKIQSKGPLKNNIHYINSLENIYGYLLLGIFFLALLIGFSLLIECAEYPNFMGTLSPFTLLSFGMAGLFFFLYYVNFKKEG